MTVIVSNGNTTLSTTGGFYRAEAYNLGAYSVTGVSLSATVRKLINVTFANAGNLQGIVLALQISYQSSTINDRSVMIELEEQVGCTLAIANPGVVTANNHTLVDGTCIQFATTGALPSGLVAGTNYYVYANDINTFWVCASAAQAISHTGRINFTGSQSGTQTYWVTRTAHTMTASQIACGSSNASKYWLPSFLFATPYAVDTTANKWRFSILMVTGSVGTWTVATSDATNPFYVAWCDTAATFADNDCVIFKDVVTIDKSATFRGVLGTGDTVYSTCAVICNGSDLTSENITNLVWQNPPVSSYTLTVNGIVLWGSGSGTRIGSSTAPIAFAVQAVIDFITPTVGTNVTSQFAPPFTTVQYASGALFVYGELPSVRKTTLAADALVSQADIVTVDATGWANGSIIAIGKEDKQIATNHGYLTVLNVVGTTITMSANLTSKRLAGATVFIYTGYGVKFTSSSSSTSVGQVKQTYPMNHLTISGAWMDDVLLVGGNIASSNIGGWVEDDQYTADMLIENCVWGSSLTTGGIAAISITAPCRRNIYVNDIYSSGLVNLVYCSSAFGSTIGKFYVDGIICLGGANTRVINTLGVDSLSVKNSRFENMGNALLSANCYDLILDNNYFYGSAAYGAVALMDRSSVKNSGLGYSARNTFNRNAVCWFFFGGAFMQTYVDDGSTYGDEYANTVGVQVGSSCLVDLEIANCIGSVGTTICSMTLVTNGTKIRFSNYGGVTGKDFIYLAHGNTVRTMAGLTDATVHTSGGSAIRFESTSSANPLRWAFNVPTGNILGRTMSIAVWVNVNDAGYYAGIHQLPRLTVTYDKTTTAYCQAQDMTGWQLLSVAFAPTTGYGQIEVALTTMTDAVGSLAYVYFDNFAILYPAGYQLDLGAMDLWANALPITPPIATNLSASSVWTALAATSFGAGTMGEVLKSAERKADDATALILAK